MAEHCETGYKLYLTFYWLLEHTWMKIVTKKENFMWGFHHHLIEAVIVDSNDIIAMLSDADIWWCEDLL